MKKYMALQSPGWETDSARLEKVCEVALAIADAHREQGARDDLNKAKFMIKRLLNEIKPAYLEDKLPKIVDTLETTLQEFTIELSKFR